MPRHDPMYWSDESPHWARDWIHEQEKRQREAQEAKATGQPPPSRHPDVFVCGLDLGKLQDYSALAALQVSPPEPAHYAVRDLKRWPLGTAYVDIVRQVGEYMRRPQLGIEPVLVIDASGVGSAVVEMFLPLELPRLIPVYITGGQFEASPGGGGWHVPKRELAATVQALLQSHRLQVSTKPLLAPRLKQELSDFAVRATDAGHDTYAGRAGAHDDMVLSVALASWFAEKRLIVGSICSLTR